MSAANKASGRFFEKKLRKKLCPETMLLQTPGGPEQKSFLVLFFKKELLASFITAP